MFIVKGCQHLVLAPLSLNTDDKLISADPEA